MIGFKPPLPPGGQPRRDRRDASSRAHARRVKSHLIRAFSALRRRSQAEISRTKDALVRNATVEALADHHADLDLDHVEPARMLRRVVELEQHLGSLEPTDLWLPLCTKAPSPVRSSDVSFTT